METEREDMTGQRRYPHLFSPIDMGPLRLRHRATMSAHGMGYSEGRSGVSERLHDYVLARARGGAALVGTESAPVHESSTNSILRINLFSDEVVPSLAKLADAVHGVGGKISLVLWHGGHVVSFAEGAKQAAVAPTPIPNLNREVPRELNNREIKELVKAYGMAARRCRSAGLDAVEVQTATSYLLGSFLSPAMNHRTDEYGGSRQNRIRLVQEILSEVREAAGGEMAVGVRTSSSHHIPGAPVDYDLDESVAAMKALADDGLVDWVSVLSGSRWAPAETIPPMSWKRMQLSEEGRRFKKELSVPVIIAGRIRTPEEAEELIRDGCADVVAMARTWIAEPEWANKAEAGRRSSIRPCMSCNQACAALVYAGHPGTCVLNPTAGRERELPPPTPATKSRSIAVVGAGPAGLEAARVAAEAKHRVTLYEATSQLGGEMRIAAEAPYRQEMQPALDWWESELKRLGVEIKLETFVSEDSLPQADTVFWAVGASPGHTQVWRLRPWLREGIPGSNGLPHGREILTGERSVSGRILVIDEEGGWPAISLVETLAARRDIKKISVTTTEEKWGAAALAMTRELPDVSTRIAALGVEVRHATTVAEIDGKMVVTTAGEKIGPFDDIVLSLGQIAGSIPEGVTAIGDCLAPRGIWAATADAARSARQIL